MRSTVRSSSSTSTTLARRPIRAAKPQGGSKNCRHVLTACGVDVDTARGSLRLSLGKDNTMAECRRLVEILPGIVEKLRRLQPSYRERATANASS